MRNGKLLQVWILLTWVDIIIGVHATGCKVRCAHRDSHNAHPQSFERIEERIHELVTLLLIYCHVNKLGRGIGHSRAKTIDLLHPLSLIDIESGEKATPLGTKIDGRLGGKLIRSIGGCEPGAHLCSRCLLVEEWQEEHHQHYSSGSEPAISLKMGLHLP